MVLQIGQIHRYILGAEPGIIEATLGQTTNVRHLATLKGRPSATARARALALMTAGARLASAAAVTSTHAFAAMLRARVRFQIM
jgi:hypothetical protein